MRNSAAVIAKYWGDMPWLRRIVMTKTIRYSLYVMVSNGKIFMMTGAFNIASNFGLLSKIWLQAVSNSKQLIL